MQCMAAGRVGCQCQVAGLVFSNLWQIQCMAAGRVGFQCQFAGLGFGTFMVHTVYGWWEGWLSMSVCWACIQHFIVHTVYGCWEGWLSMSGLENMCQSNIEHLEYSIQKLAEHKHSLLVNAVYLL